MSVQTIDEFIELHVTLGLLQNLEVGLIVVDKHHVVQLWNGFMENHSGVNAAKVKNQHLFMRFPELPETWLKHKLDAVFLLKNPAYISWEQRPYLFHFKNHRPITGLSEYMYQNVTLIPLNSPSGEVEHVGILIYDVTDIAENRQALQQANLQLQALSREDKLTGLYNRGYWEECLEHEFDRFVRSQTLSSVVMLDIDFFKKVNDTYGHQAGDEVIRVVANTLQDHARKTDIVGRYGGEEFGIILLDTNGDRAMVFAERVRAAVEALTVSYGEHVLRFTISLGVAECRNEFQTALEWLEQADQALYQSKQSGRNWVTLADADE